MTDFQNLVVLASGIMTFLALATTVWNFVSSGSRANAKAITSHAERLNLLEQQVKTMPGKDDLHQLQLELTRMSGSMQTISAVMEGNQKIMSRLEMIVTRHEDHMLSEGRK